MLGLLKHFRHAVLLSSAVLIAVVATLIIHYVVVRILAALAKRRASTLDELAIKHLRQPTRWVLVFIVVRLTVQPAAFPAPWGDAVRQLLSIGLIPLVAWLAIRLVAVVSDAVLLHANVSVTDNLHARTIQTQVNALRRLAVVTIGIVALGAVLMAFPEVRQLGGAILTSAGIAGVVLGLAAQKTLGNLIAGLQIALTQPIRLDDVVVVEGEWGRIEEITLTYVVVRIWDLRRLVLPITYFVEQPFQNWTRVSADILGTVFLYVDYTVPVEELRAELGRILESSGLWDGKVNVLQVTNTSDRTIELRALMSAGDSGTAWNLRCLVREKLVEFVRARHPDALPRFRAEVRGPATRRQPAVES